MIYYKLLALSLTCFIMFLCGIFTANPLSSTPHTAPDDKKDAIPTPILDQKNPIQPQVLGAVAPLRTTAGTPSGTIEPSTNPTKVPAATRTQSLSLEGPGVTSLQNQSGALQLVDGKGIAIDGLSFTNTGVTALQDQSGDLHLEAGEGLSINGLTITNTDPGSALDVFRTILVGGNQIAASTSADTLSLAAGPGINLSTDSLSKRITIAAVNTIIDLAGSEVTGVLPISRGGTGAVDVAGVVQNLGLKALAFQGVDTTVLTNYLPLSGGILTGSLTVPETLTVTGNTTDVRSGNIRAINGHVYARGIFDEKTATPGIYMGYGPQNDSPRFLLSNGVSSQNFQIDNSFGTMRFFTPGNVLLQLTPNNIVFNKVITTASNTKLYLIPNGTGYTTIGDASSTSRGFNTNDDLFVSGRLEVDGLSYFDNNVAIRGNLKVGAGYICLKNTESNCTGNTPGTLYATNTTVQAADLAENYISSQKLEPGDIVMTADTNEQAVKLTNNTYQQQILGIVSTNPGVTLNSDAKTDDTHPYLYPIALSGRVPVKVSTENGTISVGDLLTSSSVPGVAMKATRQGTIIGKALTPYNGSGIGKIPVFVNLASTISAENNTVAKSSGEGKIVRGTTEIVIPNLETKNTSRILVTPTVVTESPLAVVKKEQGTSFTVALAKPADKDITFDWAIIE